MTDFGWVSTSLLEVDWVFSQKSFSHPPPHVLIREKSNFYFCIILDQIVKLRTREGWVKRSEEIEKNWQMRMIQGKVGLLRTCIARLPYVYSLAKMAAFVGVFCFEGLWLADIDLFLASTRSKSEQPSHNTSRDDRIECSREFIHTSTWIWDRFLDYKQIISPL